MPFDVVSVDVHEDEIKLLMMSEETREFMYGIGDEVARLAEGFAPKRTGKAASTIHAEMFLRGDSWDADVSWTWPDAYYLYWHETGTVKMKARPFLVPALWAAQ
jgi:hypothetical protein